MYFKIPFLGAGGDKERAILPPTPNDLSKSYINL